MRHASILPRWWAESGELRLDDEGTLYVVLRDRNGEVAEYAPAGSTESPSLLIGDDHEDDLLELAWRWRRAWSMAEARDEVQAIR